jgi:chromosome segregation ATPase
MKLRIQQQIDAYNQRLKGQKSDPLPDADGKIKLLESKAQNAVNRVAKLRKKAQDIEAKIEQDNARILDYQRQIMKVSNPDAKLMTDVELFKQVFPDLSKNERYRIKEIYMKGDAKSAKVMVMTRIAEVLGCAIGDLVEND